jgi:hypothetical protein
MKSDKISNRRENQLLNLVPKTLPLVKAWHGRVAGIHELFPDIAAQGTTPPLIERHVSDICEPRIRDVIAAVMSEGVQSAWEEAKMISAAEDRKVAGRESAVEAPTSIAPFAE